MAQKLLIQAEKFITLGDSLNKKGIKKKEIAAYLGLYPSAYSALVNLIFKQLLALPPYAVEEKETIHHVFAQVNNVSEKRVRRELDGYLQKLHKLDRETSNSGSQAHTPSFDIPAGQSAQELTLSKLVGIYHCYYMSSFGYQVKQEPFVIGQDASGACWAQKGNARGPSAYRGTVYLSNHLLLTIQLQELERVDPDHFFIHLSLPPAYPDTLNLIKGMAVSMDTSHSPISRKCILYKQCAEIDMETFEQMETQFFAKDMEDYPSEIISYLYASPSLMEYLPVPRPTFDAADLSTELRISSLLDSEEVY